MLFSLPKEPKYSTHHYADWVELLCVTDLDGEMDEARVREEAQQQSEDLGEDGLAVMRDDAADAEQGKAAKQDRWHRLVTDWFAHLRFRAAEFGPAYPFELIPGENRIKLKPGHTTAHQLYLALLMSANLRCFKQQQSDLTASFELICLELFRVISPPAAEVHLFGANKLNHDIYSGGKLWDKIGKLADDLHERVLIEERHFSPRDSGDNGLDLVAHLPCGDKNPGKILWFGQCACTTEWVQKQDSSSGTAWREVIHLTSVPLNVICIPFCLRNTDGTWHQPQDQRGHVMMDRPRILYLLRNREDRLKPLPAIAAVAELLSTKSDVN